MSKRPDCDALPGTEELCEFLNVSKTAINDFLYQKTRRETQKRMEEKSGKPYKGPVRERAGVTRETV